MSVSSIVRIDMHIRDERVLAFIVERTASGAAQINHDQIARKFLCHRNTAGAILKRLQLAGHLEVDRSAKRGGYTYRAKVAL